jgi:MerR family transcriptional regulator, light-induced transcriptional regulator
MYNFFMTTNLTQARFPIRELALRTGVHTSTLRAWETRHGLLRPDRTPTGHRLYSDDDVRRVERLLELTNQGLSLTEIAPLLRPSSERPVTKTPGIAPAWQGYLTETLRALEDFSTERLDALYNEACALYPIGVVTQNLLIPMLEQVGTRWDQRPSGIAEEHFFSAWLRNKLGARLHHGQALKRGKPLILACLPHEQHEIGLLLFALASLEMGYRVIYLGADMPTRQIVHVSTQTHALGIVLAGREVRERTTLLDDIGWLVTQAKTPVFVGSHVARQLAGQLTGLGAIPLGEDIQAGLRAIDARLSGGKRSRPAERQADRLG